MTSDSRDGSIFSADHRSSSKHPLLEILQGHLKTSVVIPGLRTVFFFFFFLLRDERILTISRFCLGQEIVIDRAPAVDSFVKLGSCILGSAFHYA